MAAAARTPSPTTARRRGLSALLPALLLLSSSLLPTVVSQGTSCGSGLAACPASAPCCSEYGWCGSSALFCSQGCNPMWSHTTDACAPVPLCVDQTTTFADLARVQPNASLWDGNATAFDFVVNEGAVLLADAGEGAAMLTLTEGGAGTKMSSTRYVHYGRISATLKTAASVGVVTAFITMSDVKDEIDIEMPGAARDQFQTNWFGLGLANYTAGRSATVGGLTDTHDGWHTYALDWRPDALSWSVDGDVKETLHRDDTLSADGSYYQYPSTPARVQLSIWPAGISTSAQGTIDWAGGMIDWASPEYTAEGYYRVLVRSVSIECAPSAPVNASAIAYAYAADNGTEGKPYALATDRSPLVSAARGRPRAVGPVLAGLGGGALLAALL